MGDRSSAGPAEFLIWGASMLLATLLGVGTSYLFWTVLHQAKSPELVDVVLVGLSIGLLVLGFASQRPLARAFLILFAAALLAGFLIGGPYYLRLVA